MCKAAPHHGRGSESLADVNTPPGRGYYCLLLWACKAISPSGWGYPSWPLTTHKYSRVTCKMVPRSSSVWVLHVRKGPTVMLAIKKSAGCTFESEPSPTSAHACGEVTGCMPAAKRSASVAPEVDLGECTLHSPPQK